MLLITNLTNRFKCDKYIVNSQFSISVISSLRCECCEAAVEYVFLHCNNNIKTGLYIAADSMFTVDFFFFLSDSVTVSPQFNVTEEGVIQSANSSFESSPTTGLPAIYTTVTQSTGTDATDDNPNPSDVTVTAGGQTNCTHISVTSPPATHTDPNHLNTSGDLDIDSNYTLNTSTISDESLSSNQTTTLSYGGTVFESTREMRNESITSPEDSSTQRSLTESDPGATPTLNIATLRAIHHEGKNTIITIISIYTVYCDQLCVTVFV